MCVARINAVLCTFPAKFWRCVFYIFTRRYQDVVNNRRKVSKMLVKNLVSGYIMNIFCNTVTANEYTGW
jgi:hypothetical protein